MVPGNSADARSVVVQVGPPRRASLSPQLSGTPSPQAVVTTNPLGDAGSVPQTPLPRCASFDFLDTDYRGFAVSDRSLAPRHGSDSGVGTCAHAASAAAPRGTWTAVALPHGASPAAQNRVAGSRRADGSSRFSTEDDIYRPASRRTPEEPPAWAHTIKSVVPIVCLSSVAIACAVWAAMTLVAGNASATPAATAASPEATLRMSSGAWEWATGHHARSCAEYVSVVGVPTAETRHADRAPGHASAVFRIDPDGTDGVGQPLRVLCDDEGFMLLAKVHPMTSTDAAQFSALPDSWLSSSARYAPETDAAATLLSAAHAADVNRYPSFASHGEERALQINAALARIVVRHRTLPSVAASWYKRIAPLASGSGSALATWFSAATPAEQPPTHTCEDASMEADCVSSRLRHNGDGVTIIGTTPVSANGQDWPSGASFELHANTGSELGDEAAQDMLGGVCVVTREPNDAQPRAECGHGMQVWVR